MTLLDVQDLSIEFGSGPALTRAVDELSLTLTEGETYGLVGESGSGKSVSMMALLGLLPSNARISGDIKFLGRSLDALSRRDLKRTRAQDIGVVFQDPMTSLNPTMRVGRQVEEKITRGAGESRDAVRSRAIELLEEVGIANPSQRSREYPHQLSGGMKQRVMIAMAIASRPKLLIADEPTTALDVTVQAQILDLLRDLVREHGTTLVLVTHDLGVAAGLCREIMVMYRGRVVEHQPADRLFESPAHPYTSSLLRAVPRIDHVGQLFEIPGSPTLALDWSEGCAFQPRCGSSQPDCLGRSNLLLEPRLPLGVRCLHPHNNVTHSMGGPR